MLFQVGSKSLCALLIVVAGAMAQTPPVSQPPSPVPAVAVPAEPPVPADPNAPVPPGKIDPGPGQPLEDKRVFGVLPNYRTANGQVPFVAISTKQKFTIATKDSFDYPVLLTTAFFAGLSQAEGNDNNVYGQGVKGFAHRYGISYVDQVVGNYFPEAIVPSLFHIDPRYFRKGTGSYKSRLWYSLNRIFVCKSDNGTPAFNANEFVGNSLASLAGLAYHPHQRTAGDAVSQFVTYVATDAFGQVAKEFWPDLKRIYGHRHQPAIAQP